MTDTRPPDAHTASVRADTNPLAGTARRLSALDEHLTYVVDRPIEPGWLRLADLTCGQTLVAWHAELSARHGDRRAAATYLGVWLADAAVNVWALPLWAEGRLPLTGPQGVLVRRHAEGWPDAVGVDGATAVAVLSDDRATGELNTRLASTRHVLAEGLAQRLGSMEPLFQALAGTLPVGLPALWGGLADSLAGRALWLARLLHRDRRCAWKDAAELIGRLVADRPIPRPRAFPVLSAHGSDLFAVRGTCCLYYRTVAHPDRDGRGYCNTCPLRTDASRLRRLRAHLEEERTVP